MAILQMDDVRHRFDGPEVVRGVSLALDAGEFLCLLGPSGCGKTTLLRLAAGLERVQQGRVSIGGQIVGSGEGIHVPPEARRIGLMFQDFALFPHLTVRQNLLFGVNGRDSRRRRWVEDRAQRLGISTQLDTYPHTLSGGQQQRVALVRAMAPAPRVLLLDEPFSGLDVTRRFDVREQTQTMLQELDVATLMVTHDPEEAMFMADRILVMEKGRILQAGTPEEIYFRPASPFVAALFGPVNHLEGKVRGGRVETVLGDFPAPNLEHGACAQVLIRPEALVLVPGTNGQGVSFKVVNSRLLGNAIHLRLTAASVSGTIELQARIIGDRLPRRGSTVALGAVEGRKAFVFPS